MKLFAGVFWKLPRKSGTPQTVLVAPLTQINARATGGACWKTQRCSAPARGTLYRPLERPRTRRAMLKLYRFAGEALAPLWTQVLGAGLNTNSRQTVTSCCKWTVAEIQLTSVVTQSSPRGQRFVPVGLVWFARHLARQSMESVPEVPHKDAMPPPRVVVLLNSRELSPQTA